MAVDTPTGMSGPDEDLLVFHRGHPHIIELNNPIEYSQRPAQSYDPVAHYQWRQERSDANRDTGNPIVPPDPGVMSAVNAE